VIDFLLLIRREISRSYLGYWVFDFCLLVPRQQQPRMQVRRRAMKATKNLSRGPLGSLLLLVSATLILLGVVLSSPFHTLAAAARAPDQYRGRGRRGGGGDGSSAAATTTAPVGNVGNTLPRSSSGQLSQQNGSGAAAAPRYRRTPPWNPSDRIDPTTGYLNGLFVRVPGEWEEEVRLRTSHTLHLPCQIRQVPGDGNCLFHSISISLCLTGDGSASAKTRGTGLLRSSNATARGGGCFGDDDDDDDELYDFHNFAGSQQKLQALYELSQELRARAVECLRGGDGRCIVRGGSDGGSAKRSRHGNRRLFLQGRESLRCSDLVEAAAQQYGMTAHEYCASMEQDSVWGGGPEIVALSNLLQRPIHVYELMDAKEYNESRRGSSHNDRDNRDARGDQSSSNIHHLLDDMATGCGRAGFVLRRMACFGSPKFDRQPALHILSADSRFPDIAPGRQLRAGNHFLAVFPVERHQPTNSDSNDDGDPRRSRRRTWARGRMRGGDAVREGGARSSCSSSSEQRHDDGVGRASGAEPARERSVLRRVADSCSQWWREVFARSSF
jgi:OTU-like cysteine protease